MISSISRTHAVVMHTRALMTAPEVVPTGNMLSAHWRPKQYGLSVLRREASLCASSLQELVDAARSGLLSNQHALAALQAKVGLPADASTSNNAFSAAMDEFDRVMRSGDSGDLLSSFVTFRLS